MRGQKLGKVVVAPENADQFAEWSVEHVKKQFDVTLDYSVASLRNIDEILEGFHARASRSMMSIYRCLLSAVTSAKSLSVRIRALAGSVLPKVSMRANWTRAWSFSLPQEP